ncbi:hypothetical protein Plhal304r1_c035g0108031 [Plasmopara halstedii]
MLCGRIVPDAIKHSEQALIFSVLKGFCYSMVYLSNVIGNTTDSQNVQ